MLLVYILSIIRVVTILLVLCFAMEILKSNKNNFKMPLNGYSSMFDVYIQILYK